MYVCFNGLQTRGCCSRQPTGNQVSLAEILKGELKSVKLRKVEGRRSPGGTLRRKRKIRRDPSCPADYIAMALENKFKVSPFLQRYCAASAVLCVYCSIQPYTGLVEH